MKKLSIVALTVGLLMTTCLAIAADWDRLGVNQFGPVYIDTASYKYFEGRNGNLFVRYWVRVKPWQPIRSISRVDTYISVDCSAHDYLVMERRALNLQQKIVSQEFDNQGEGNLGAGTFSKDDNSDVYKLSANRACQDMAIKYFQSHPNAGAY